MTSPEFSVVAGTLARSLKPKGTQPQDAIARRWRGMPKPGPSSASPDVIPLLDGWIRRLEREAGSDDLGSGPR